MKLAIPAFIAALALTACSNASSSDTAVANNADEANAAAENNSASALAPTNATNAANVAKPAAEATGFTKDEQTQDDADATGMTARIDRDAAETDTASNAAK